MLAATKDGGAKTSRHNRSFEMEQRLPHCSCAQECLEYLAADVLRARAFSAQRSMYYSGCSLRRVAFSSRDEARDLGELAAWVNRVHVWACEVYGLG